MPYSPPFEMTSGSLDMYASNNEGKTVRWPATDSDGDISANAYRLPFCGFASASANVGSKFVNINSLTASSGIAQLRTYNAADPSDGPSSIILGYDMTIENSAWATSLVGNEIDRLGDFLDLQVLSVMGSSGTAFAAGDLYAQVSIDGGYSFTSKCYNTNTVLSGFSINNFSTWRNEYGGTMSAELIQKYGETSTSKLIYKPSGSLRTYHRTVSQGSGMFQSFVTLSAQSSSYPPLSYANLSYVHRLMEGFSTIGIPDGGVINGKSHPGAVLLRIGFSDEYVPNTRYLQMQNCGLRFRFRTTTPMGKTTIINGEYFNTQKGLIEIASGSVTVPPDPNTGVTP